MSKSAPKSLSQLLESSGSSLARLATTAQQKIALSEHIRNGLAPDIGAEVLHCSIDVDGILTVRASSPEWAARLRFENERLLELSREIDPATTSIKVRVAYPGE
jgi:hypothetical protein